MPELPEVETIRRIIEPQLAGQTILHVTINNPQIVAYPEAEAFEKLLTGQMVKGISRRGKFLTVHFESGDRMTLHLRMTGHVDVRRFGRFWYLKACEPDIVTGREQLGLEPLDDALTADYLKIRLGGRRKAIKEMLHDQSIVAGIGNIYSDEVLFAAGIYPGTKCDALSDADWQCLAIKISTIILWGIETNQTTPEEYLAGKGKEYRNTPVLRVYGRAGRPCTTCGQTIEKATIGGRTSCYCPNCQRNPL